MDSLTQGLLGAATFAVVKNEDIGKKALIIGAVVGTVPDLDVLLAPMFNDVEFLTVHRSVSHSIFFAILMSLLLGEVAHRIYKREQSRVKWIFAFFLALFTHSLLDWFTTYGTKLISPFDDHLFSLNSIHVFEPIYTLILLSGVVTHLISKRRNNSLKTVLVVSSCYLMFGVISKNHAFYHFKSQLSLDSISYQEILVSPTPLNSFLWHGIVKAADGYYFGTYSIFDGKKKVDFQFVQSDNEILERVINNRLIGYYLDYTQGFPMVKTNKNGDTKIYAVKYGPINYYGEPEFVYPLTFNVNNLNEADIRIDYTGEQRGPVKNYRNLMRRIFGKRCVWTSLHAI